jgi:hypothetical protein
MQDSYDHAIKTTDESYTYIPPERLFAELQYHTLVFAACRQQLIIFVMLTTTLMNPQTVAST